jgi:tRNA pseudouridine13 synthase
LERADDARQALPEIVRSGVPNYFDRQRFGSVGQSGQFVAQPWCLGNYERSLWLALADANRHDRPEQRRDKEVWREHWGDWPACGAATRDPMRRHVLSHLLGRPSDFRGAFARIEPRLRGLYVAAFQSHLWNELLARFLREACDPATLAEVPLDERCYPFFQGLDAPVLERLAAASLPLPSARLHGIEESLRLLLEQVVGEAGLELRQVRIKYPRDSFFSKGIRPAVFRPADWSAQVASDELHAGRRKLLLAFELPRGCYATVLLKQLTVRK